MPWQRNQNEKSRYKSESREFRMLHDGDDKERERKGEALLLMLALYPSLSPFLSLFFSHSEGQLHNGGSGEGGIAAFGIQCDAL
jgi:hypothetical protein